MWFTTELTKWYWVPTARAATCIFWIKGAEERASSDGEIYAHYANDDIFDVRSQFEPHTQTSIYRNRRYLKLPITKRRVFSLSHTTPTASSPLTLIVTSTRKALIEAAQQQQNLLSSYWPKSTTQFYHPPLILEPDQPINQVTNPKEQGLDSALVHLEHDGPKALIITFLSVRNRHTDQFYYTRWCFDDRPLDTPVGEIATYPVLHVNHGDFLFNAMITMTRNRVKKADGLWAG